MGRLPTFLIIGAPKSGTSSLAAYLAAHPGVFMSAEKELHFFDDHFDRGLEWYRSRFDGAGAAAAVGEATPTYMHFDEPLARMAQALPDAKLVALLRNPVDRAYSGYWWNRAVFERRSFEDAMRDNMRDREEEGFNYLNFGRYARRLRRVVERYPRASLHVVLFDDLTADPAAEFADVCRFIGVDDAFRPQEIGKAHNIAYRPRSERLREVMLRMRAWRRLPFGLADRIDRLNRAPLSYPPMDPRLRAELVEWYAADNAELAAWLGRELPGSWGR